MISTIIELIPIGLLQGLILAILVTGTMIPFKLLDFPDLTAEGSYPLGGAICGALIIWGVNPAIALITACVSSGLLGVCTAFIHLRYKINTLLAGIIISTMIYSINLRLMGKPNIALFDYAKLFPDIGYGIMPQLISLLVINLVIASLLYLVLNTEKGLQFRAVGLNPNFAERQGINLKENIFFGLFIGNALCGLSGALIVQIQGYADISMGVGIIIHALAAMMIGEKIIGTQTIPKLVVFPLIGALIYQQIQSVALSAGLAPSDLKLLTGTIALMIISIKN